MLNRASITCHKTLDLAQAIHRCLKSYFVENWKSFKHQYLEIGKRQRLFLLLTHHIDLIDDEKVISKKCILIKSSLDKNDSQFLLVCYNILLNSILGFWWDCIHFKAKNEAIHLPAIIIESHVKEKLKALKLQIS